VLDFLQLADINKAAESSSASAPIPRARAESFTSGPMLCLCSVMLVLHCPLGDEAVCFPSVSVDEAAKAGFAIPSEPPSRRDLRCVIMCNIGTCEWVLNDLDGADITFRRVLDLNRDHSVAKASLQQVAAARKQSQRKADSYSSALALHSTGQYDGAAERYREAISVRNSGRKRFVKKFSTSSCYFQADPGDALCYYGLGVCLTALGCIDEAIHNLRRALELKPSDVLTISALASALHATAISSNVVEAKALYQ
jgi:tetratricopeptide (TPR) repeat protein